MLEVLRCIDRASELPQSGIRVPRTNPERDVRRFVVRRFPYLVVTAVVNGGRAVVAVVHGRRKPDYWRNRLR